MNDPLFAISPIDGRYFNQISPLLEFFSEYALIKTRTEIEIKYLLFLSDLGIIRKLSKKERGTLTKIYLDFSIKDANYIKKIEEKVRHDVKALEYFIREKSAHFSISDLSNWIHFGLTSADINDNAYRLMIKRALNTLLIKEIESLLGSLNKISKTYQKLPMLGRTHGQGAVPTTFGKEIAVFSERVSCELQTLVDCDFYGKLGGAVGNWNAHEFAYPNFNWPKESKKFLESIGLKQSRYTTQIAPIEDVVRVLQNLFRLNSILIDFNQDIWRYISDDWLTQKGKEGFVGSSTMPQKVNPIEFENSEGNLVLANGIIETLCRKLPISRLQRDLSDSTVLRNIGVIFAHCLIAYKNCMSGIQTIAPNKEKMNADLTEDWSILSEALQTILRKNGKEKAYEEVSKSVRGKKLNKEGWIKLIEPLSINEFDKKRLLELTPNMYLGYSDKNI